MVSTTHCDRADALAAATSSEATGVDDRESFFRELVEVRRRKGHDKVALRYILMMEAQGFDIVENHRRYRLAASERCSPNQLWQIREQVQAWIDMVSASPQI